MGTNCSNNACGRNSREEDVEPVAVGGDAMPAMRATALAEHFYVGEKIGEGSFASVVSGTCKRTGTQRAIKCMERSHPDFDKVVLEREVSMMQLLRHPNVVRLIQHIDTPKTAYLVMELCGGGDLLDKIVAEKQLIPDEDAADIAAQMLRGIEHLHECCVAHRDIKPENFLLFRKSSLGGNVIKLSDFGLAALFDDACPQSFQDALGTVRYVAPEVVGGESYGPECDLWGCGATIYTMLSRSVPIVGDSEAVLAILRSGARWTFWSDAWKEVSDDAKNLVSRLMVVNPAHRYSAAQALLDPWLCEMPLASGDGQSCCSLASAGQTPRIYSMQSRQSADSRMST